MFPTEEEAEYPEGMAAAYAKAIKEELADRGMMGQVEGEARLAAISTQLNKYHRMDDPELKVAMAQRILEIEKSLEQARNMRP